MQLRPTPTYGTGFARYAAESAYPELWRGLVGCWSPALGATGGQLLDWSGHQWNGSWNSTGNQNWIAGAADFNGTWSDYVRVSGFPFLPTFTLIARIKIDTILEQYHGVITRGAVWESDTNFDMCVRFRSVTSDYRLVLYYRNGSTLYGNQRVLIDNVSPVNAWHWFAVSYDGVTIKFYQNGINIGEGSPGAGPSDGGQDLKLGAPTYNAWASDKPFDGKMDNAYVYNYALSGNAISLLATGASPLTPMNRIIPYVAAVGGVSPTSTLYGPLYGPLAGVI